LTFDDVQIATSETVAAVSGWLVLGYVGVINAQESEKKLREIWLPLGRAWSAVCFLFELYLRPAGLGSES
jgi:hypothetical protein